MKIAHDPGCSGQFGTVDNPRSGGVKPSTMLMDCDSNLNIHIFCQFCLQSLSLTDLSSPSFWYLEFSCQLTFWNSPFNYRKIGRKAFLSNGTVSVDCQSQDSSVGEDPAWGVLPTVPPNVWPNWKGKEERKRNCYSELTQMGLTTVAVPCGLLSLRTCPIQPSSYMKGNGQSTGEYKDRGVMAWINLHNPDAWCMCENQFCF